jgi:hypothetical protein
MLSEAQSTQCGMIGWVMNNELERMWKDVVMAKLGTLLAFAWMNWGKPWKTSVKKLVLAIFEPGTSKIWSKNIIHLAMTFSQWYLISNIFIIPSTQHGGWVVSVRALYSGGSNLRLETGYPAGFCCFPHSLQATAGIVPKNRPWLLPSISFQIRYSFIVLSFNAVTVSLLHFLVLG